ncbi:mechanosensitive ion channel family protein [Clostridium sp. YIM B02551]|uniref:mechanosensitive ion channel family protein n=1 Tax=Clostridium sp. YIM B02551 TaxID=2910679 RepID=UPI001EEB95F8|nr:mechanosensitive ion channel family protein [Clostridium sp. YIM B02551]
MYVFQSLFSIDAEKKTLDIGGKIVNIQFLFNIAWGIVKILVILILMYLAVRIGNYIIEKFVHKQIKSEIRFTMDEKKANTVGEVLKSILRYSVYFIGGIGIFANLFSGVSLTFASIGGVALGFGTQSLVKDIINGFFVLFEDQYAVGDYITIGDNSGIVESIGIRMTQLKDFNGDMHYIPNGTISQVTNHSRGDMSVIVDVEIAYKENIDIAIEVINNACEKVAAEKEHVIEKPKVIGVQSLGVSAVVIRVLGKTEPMYQWALERELRKEIKLTMEREGIERPQGKVEVIKSKE